MRTSGDPSACIKGQGHHSGNGVRGTREKSVVPAAHIAETQPMQEGSRLARMGACKFNDCIFQRD